MIRCLDIHTHHPAPQPEGVVNVSPSGFSPLEGQWYSLGIHPWATDNEILPIEWENFERLARRQEVVAIGECGIDKIKGGPLYRQMLVMKRQIDISEKLGKPLVIHDVKAHEIITGFKREFRPSQNWLVHGFRGKPTVMKMLTENGIYLSFGENFNEESLRLMPRELILAETDESPLSIEAIIEHISDVRGENMTGTILENTSRFLGIEPIEN